MKSYVTSIVFLKTIISLAQLGIRNKKIIMMTFILVNQFVNCATYSLIIVRDHLGSGFKGHTLLVVVYLTSSVLGIIEPSFFVFADFKL